MNQCNKFGRKLRILSLCFILLAAVTVFAVTPFAFAEDQTVYDEAAAEESSAGILEEEPFIPPVSCTNVAPFGEPVQGAAPAYAVQAANDGAETDDGMVLSKTATANNDGTYTIQMEAYATGEKVISEVSKDVPTDIVLVLDQSGSMAHEFGDALRNSDNADTTKGSIEGYYVYKQVTSDFLGTSTNYYPVRYNSGTWQYHYQDDWGNNSSWYNIDNNWNNVYISRLGALKDAVTSFSDAVAGKAKGADINSSDDDIDHRIAVVGFASGRRFDNIDYDYGNTELFVGDNQYTYNAGSSNNSNNKNSAQSHYSEAFQNMSTSAGVSNIAASVNALGTDGGTLTNLGLEMANGIFLANSIEGQRNRVVIVFTDGEPGWSGFDVNTANSAINQANSAKKTYGATVYTVGIFSNANASNPGNLPANNDTNNNKNNRFMHLVSSNYPDATSMTVTGNVNSTLNEDPNNPKSYYLSAKDAGALNNIFQQISDQIESGNTTSLDANSVIKDVVSPYFTMPQNTADIKVYTAESDGNTNSWKDRQEFSGTVNIDAENSTVSVTNFSFKDNWCGNETNNGVVSFHNGKKLIIEFKVSPKKGFLGGNNVPTNANAGIYAKEGDANAVKTFEVPTVNVPIPNITVTAADKNVYLLQNPTDDQLKAGMTVTCGDVDITDPSKLEDWQKEFVEIDTPSVSKNEAFDATADGTYTITASVSPKDDGSEEAESGTGTAKINVFKPEVTFKDSQIYLGQTVENYDVNLADVQWKHEDTIADSTNMGGASAPELAYSYNPINPSEYDFKKDTGVKVTGVTINNTSVINHVTFSHDACDVLESNCQFGKEGFTLNDCNFIVHVKGFDLMIQKQGAQSIDENQSFIFNVEKLEGDKWVLVTQAVVLGNSYVTITELPIGTYRVVEDQNWSWRYNLQSVTGGVVGDMQPFANQIIFDGVNGDLSKTLIFTNTRTQTKWLNGSAFCQNYWTKDADGNWKVEKHTFPNQENN